MSLKSDSAPALLPITSDVQSTQSIVLRQLREAMISGRIKAGDKLTVRDLAQQLGVSTMPVRQALSTLEAEGYIQHNHHRAFEVPPLSLEEVETIYLTRVRLEPLAAELVAQQHSDSDLALLQTLVTRVDDAISAHDFDKFLKADWALHDGLYNLTRRPRLLKLIQEIRRGAMRYRDLYNIGHQAVEEMAQTQSEHRAMLNAITNQDADTAGKMIAAGLHRWVAGLREAVEKIEATR